MSKFVVYNNDSRIFVATRKNEEEMKKNVLELDELDLDSDDFDREEIEDVYLDIDVTTRVL